MLLTADQSILARFVRVEEAHTKTRYIVGAGCRRAGQRGACIAIISLRNSPGYEVVLQLDDGRIESFAPMRLFPDPSNAADR